MYTQVWGLYTQIGVSCIHTSVISGHWNMVYPQVGHTNGGQPWRMIKCVCRSMLPTSRAPWRCLTHCGHPHLPVVKCRGARTGRSQLLLEPAAVTVKRFPRRVGDSPRRSGVCPTTAWCGVRLTALKHPRCGHPHAPVVKCRGARTGRSLLLLESAAVTVKRSRVARRRGRRVPDHAAVGHPCAAATWRCLRP